MSMRRLLALIVLCVATIVTLGNSASAALARSACAGKGACCETPGRTAPGQEKPHDKGTHGSRGDENGNDDDHPVSTECPPPTVPEAPLNVLLPLSAMVVIGAVVVGSRRRARLGHP